MADTVIKAMTPLLRWLIDMLAFFQTESIKIPVSYREKVLAVKDLLNDDSSGLINTVLDYAINSALVSYKIETDNENLSEVLNDWLENINEGLRGKVPTGLESLAKEYFRERWKGSSNILLRTFWEDKNGLKLPTSLFFVDGEDIKVSSKSNDGLIRLGDEIYYIRNSNTNDYYKINKKDIRLPRNDNEMIFAQKPFESWGVREPVPFIIKRGLYRNCVFLKTLSKKGEDMVSKAIERMVVLKKGTERLFLDGNVAYSKEDLEKVSQDFKEILDKKRNEGGTATYTTNFDTDISEFIPEYAKAINQEVYSTIEKRILAGLGLVDILEGSSSTRRESILNPKPFMSEVEQGIHDFKSLVTDIIQTIISENLSSHKKWMNAKILVRNSTIKSFIDDKFRSTLRSLYDRGVISKRTAVEMIGNLDFDTEVQRRDTETSQDLDEKMYPPIIMNQEGKSDEFQNEEDILPDRKGPEAKNFSLSKDYEEAPYKDNTDLPSQVKVLPAEAQSLWRRVFNQSYPKGEDYARKVAWSVVKKVYKKSGDKWVKKSRVKGEYGFINLEEMTTEELNEYISKYLIEEE